MSEQNSSNNVLQTINSSEGDSGESDDIADFPESSPYEIPSALQLQPTLPSASAPSASTTASATHEPPPPHQLHPQHQLHHHHHRDDDIDTSYFMSEPSVSEADDNSSGNVVRAPHRVVTSTMGDLAAAGGRHRMLFHHSSSDEELQHQPHPHHSNDGNNNDSKTNNHNNNNNRRRRIVSAQQRSPPIPVSPGNTSLSSWDNMTSSSPSAKKFLFQFLPERASARGSGGGGESSGGSGNGGGGGGGGGGGDKFPRRRGRGGGGRGNTASNLETPESPSDANNNNRKSGNNNHGSRSSSRRNNSNNMSNTFVDQNPVFLRMRASSSLTASTQQQQQEEQQLIAAQQQQYNHNLQNQRELQVRGGMGERFLRSLTGGFNLTPSFLVHHQQQQQQQQQQQSVLIPLNDETDHDRDRARRRRPTTTAAASSLTAAALAATPSDESYRLLPPSPAPASNSQGAVEQEQQQQQPSNYKHNKDDRNTATTATNSNNQRIRSSSSSASSQLPSSSDKDKDDATATSLLGAEHLLSPSSCAEEDGDQEVYEPELLLPDSNNNGSNSITTEQQQQQHHELYQQLLQQQQQELHYQYHQQQHYQQQQHFLQYQHQHYLHPQQFQQYEYNQQLYHPNQQQQQQHYPTYQQLHQQYQYNQQRYHPNQQQQQQQLLHHHHPMDESVAMTLSDDTDEGDHEEGEEETETTTTATSKRMMTARTTAVDKQDWETNTNHSHHSADDEQTDIRPPRAPRSAGVGGHKRTRSGDGAAAKLATGGAASWKGMEQDKIPLPPSPGDDDGDDEEGEEGAAAAAAARTTAPQRDTTFLGGRPPMHPPTNYESHEHRSWRSETQDAEEASALMQQQHQVHSGSYGSTGLAYSWVAGQQQQEQHQQQLNYHSNPYHDDQSPAWSSYNPYQAAQSPVLGDYWHPRTWNETSLAHLPDESPDFADSQHQLRSVPETGDDGSEDDDDNADDESDENSEDSQDESDDESEDESSTSSFRDVRRNRLDVGGSVGVEELERKMEDADFRGKFQKMLRSKLENANFRGQLEKVLKSRRQLRDSPFANIGKKSAEKAPRRKFLPQTSVVDDAKKKYQCYTCPRCGFRQREFLTVSSASASQLSGPSSYLALYFFLYVAASLYIFGIEEGWEPLDCIYFAVITLTTCGLGDFVPTTPANKVICSIFLYFGVACIGLLLGSYIASLLDDKASRERKSKLMESCQNCKQIQTLKEAALRRTRTDQSPGDALVPEKPQLRRFKSEWNPQPPQGHSALYCPPHSHSHNSSQPHSSNQRDSFRSSLPSQDCEEERGKFREPNENTAAASSDFVDTPPTDSGKLHTSSNPSPLSQTSTSTPSSHMLSPITRRILGRQGHTRHASIDLSNANNRFSTAFRASAVHQQSPPMSAVRPYSEATPFNAPGTRSSYGRQQSNGDKSNHISSSDSSDGSLSGSESSESTITEIADGKTSQLRAAKYVFLTLRQALVNSMVIIAFGCLGFWFIEGFSLIDSWYFTTVLLTTTGYGDITPVTRGGKLFATIYILVAGTILLNNMSLISMIPLELRKRRIEQAVLTQFGDQLDDAALRELATGPTIQRLHLSANRPDGLDECTREMFSLAMLVRLGKVTEQEIKETFAAFRRLDVNDEGVLNSKSIIAAMIQQRRGTRPSRSRTSSRSQNASRHPHNDPPPPPPQSLMRYSLPTPDKSQVMFPYESPLPPFLGPQQQQQQQQQSHQYWLQPRTQEYGYSEYKTISSQMSSSNNHSSRGESFSSSGGGGSRKIPTVSNESPF